MKTEEQIKEKIESILEYRGKLSKWDDEYPFAYHAIQVLQWVTEETTALDSYYKDED
jgi:hypothetical protein